MGKRGLRVSVRRTVGPGAILRAVRLASKLTGWRAAVAVLVIAEHDNTALKGATFNTLAAAQKQKKSERSPTRSGYPPFYGLLKGTVTIAPGVDLTEPADADWGKVYDE